MVNDSQDTSDNKQDDQEDSENWTSRDQKMQDGKQKTSDSFANRQKVDDYFKQEEKEQRLSTMSAVASSSQPQQGPKHSTSSARTASRRSRPSTASARPSTASTGRPSTSATAAAAARTASASDSKQQPNSTGDKKILEKGDSEVDLIKIAARRSRMENISGPTDTAAGSNNASTKDKEREMAMQDNRQQESDVDLMKIAARRSQGAAPPSPEEGDKITTTTVTNAEQRRNIKPVAGQQLTSYQPGVYAVAPGMPPTRNPSVQFHTALGGYPEEDGNHVPAFGQIPSEDRRDNTNNDNNNQRHPDLEQTNQPSSKALLATDVSNSKLVTAFLVDEDPSEPMPVTNQLNAAKDTAELEAQHKTKTRSMMMYLGGGMIVIVGIVLLIVFLVGGNGGDNSNEKTPRPTPSPTPEPSSLGDYVASLLPEYTMATITSDPDGRTPQSMAFEWTLAGLALTTEKIPDWKLIQRFALATFYFATDGDNSWTPSVAEGWLSFELDECDWGYFQQHDYIFEDLPENESFVMGESPCEYFNVSNTNNTTDPIITEEYHYLWLPESRLKGSLPEELYLLTSLQFLVLYGNEIGGTISNRIGQMTNLDTLSLATNQLTSSIPLEIRKCTSLRALHLGYNELTGIIPGQGIGALENLEIFWMEYNTLSGLIPSEIGLLHQLRSLQLPFNNLTDTIPSEIGNMGRLEDFNVQGLPDLTGTIPTEVGQMTSLQQLITSGTGITGHIPSEIGLLENLLLWTGQESFLTGTIPTELDKIPFLGVLSLRNNQLSGTIPVELLAMEWMYILNLRDNMLVGSIPDVGGNLSQPLNLGQLILSGNRLTGTLPQDAMTRMPFLDSLWLHDNKLSGSLPSQLGAMEYLYDLTLQGNNLSGSLPSELGLLNTTGFMAFNISNNPLLTGQIPEELCVLTEDDILQFNCANDQPEGLCGCSTCSCGISVDGSEVETAASDMDATLDTVVNDVNGTDS